MRDTQHIKTDKKQRIRGVVALVCAVCFIAVFIFSAVTFATHAQHKNEIASGCQQTLLHDCINESTAVKIQISLQTYENYELHNDCLACAFIHKTINQIRHAGLTVTEVLSADTSLYLLAALCIPASLLSINSPIELKTKSNS